MPVRIKNPLTAGGTIYGSPFIGPILYTAQIPVNIANLTTFEVDINGFIKPGVPLNAAGALVLATVPVFGVTIEAIKLVVDNTAGNRVGTFDIAVCTFGQVNRGVIEAILGRALTAAEIAGFALAGSTMKLLS